MEGRGNARTVSREEFAVLTARPELRMILICIVVAVTGIVQGFRHAWNSSALVLLAGSVGAVVGMLAFGRTLSTRERSTSTTFLALAGFAPYVFGCYLVFVRGIWHGRSMLESFSVVGLAATVAFIYLGYRLVYWQWYLTEIAEALRKGDLIVLEKARSA